MIQRIEKMVAKAIGKLNRFFIDACLVHYMPNHLAQVAEIPARRGWFFTRESGGHFGQKVRWLHHSMTAHINLADQSQRAIYIRLVVVLAKKPLQRDTRVQHQNHGRPRFLALSKAFAVVIGALRWRAKIRATAL